jgi:fibro-slime domain-containing protein
MRSTTSLVLSATVLGTLAAAGIMSCSNPEIITSGGTSTGTHATTTASTTSGSGTGGAGGGGIDLPDASGGGGAGGCEGDGCAPASFCGDGKIDPGEKCDDSNSASGDGCSANCLIEKDFVCPTPGAACVSTVVCGDGKVSGTETCDDHNTTAGDGCDATCLVEIGWKCPTIGSKCEASACGDGHLAGKEECDDSNLLPGDGCDATCHLETGWVCPPGMPCKTTTCGDGVAEGKEACDDGNNNLGDGCTPFCVREPDCTLGACTSTCGDGLRLPNSTEECEDGNTLSGDGCSSDCKIEPGFTCTSTVINGGNTLTVPLVIRDFSSAHPDFEKFSGVDHTITAALLGADHKPAYANPGGTTPTTSGKANFDQWYNDVTGTNFTFLQTMSLTKQMSGVFQFTNTSFFPIDGKGFGNQGNNHNFHFTSEVRYWFEYKGNEQLDFTGDDDVWVFVNKQKAVDLGGVHGPLSGSVKLDAASATVFNLQIGKIYEIVVWQAERHTSGSNYTLTISNFDNSTSVCNSTCGDGVVAGDEVCDDGVNDGKYGGCTSTCLHGPFCGDGILQADAGEQCDDGFNLTPYGGCAPGCKNGGSCGDGVVDSLFGEQCDDGVNDGSYGKCGVACILGPRCGDGVVQMPQESCDDGNHISGDGCDAACVKENPK